MIKIPRFHFSLGTLVLLVMWTGIVLRMGTVQHVRRFEQLREHLECRMYGWPWGFVRVDRFIGHPDYDLVFSYRGLIWYAVAVISLATVLTWGPMYLWRRTQYWRLGTARAEHDALGTCCDPGPRYWRLAADAVVGVVVVVVLCWVSTLSLRSIFRAEVPPVEETIGVFRSVDPVEAKRDGLIP